MIDGKQSRLSLVTNRSIIQSKNHNRLFKKKNRVGFESTQWSQCDLRETIQQDSKFNDILRVVFSNIGIILMIIAIFIIGTILGLIPLFFGASSSTSANKSTQNQSESKSSIHTTPLLQSSTITYAQISSTVNPTITQTKSSSRNYLTNSITSSSVSKNEQQTSSTSVYRSDFSNVFSNTKTSQSYPQTSKIITTTNFSANKISNAYSTISTSSSISSLKQTNSTDNTYSTSTNFVYPSTISTSTLNFLISTKKTSTSLSSTNTQSTANYYYSSVSSTRNIYDTTSSYTSGTSISAAKTITNANTNSNVQTGYSTMSTLSSESNQISTNINNISTKSPSQFTSQTTLNEEISLSSTNTQTISGIYSSKQISVISSESKNTESTTTSTSSSNNPLTTGEISTNSLQTSTTISKMLTSISTFVSASSQAQTSKSRNTNSRISSSTTTWTTTIQTCPINYILPSSFNSRNCPNNTVYWSNYLSLFNSYSLGYPINQVIACYGSLIQLQCPDQQYMHIYSAYYGVQSATNTKYCASTSSSTYGTCFARYIYDFVTALCEATNECSMQVIETYFGQPCVGIDNRQLFIQYQCVDSNTLGELTECPVNSYIPSICPSLTGSNQYQSYWCEPDTTSITCPSGSLITVLCAFYGIDPNLRCKGHYYNGAPDACYSTTAFTKVAEQCNNQASCSFNGNPSYTYSGFTNACPGFSNMLFVQWKCTYSVQTQVPTSTYANTVSSSSPSSCHNVTLPGTCPDPSDFSLYEPKLLLNSTTTSFGYPIYQQIVCEGSLIVLACPANLVVHIYSGYYGIQAQTLTLTCANTTGLATYIPTMCYVSDALSTINLTCEYQNMCQLRVTSANLGGADLFPSVGKQLLLQYQCVDPSGLSSIINQCPVSKKVTPICPPLINDNSNIQEQTWCDGDTATIDCGSQLIEIVCAFYGIDQSLSACGIQFLSYHPKCYFSSSFTIVNSTCALQNSCTLDEFSSTFVFVPCYQLTNALYIQWRCI